MTQGRQCQVLLLDGRQLELLVQPKLLSRDLLDLVSSHFNLKEKEYFGISFFSETGQNNWLHLDRRVLDHDLPKKSGPLELKFCVRYYIENISFLKDTTTVELFFLNAKSAVFDEDIEVESAKVFRLAAYAVQEAKGDYTSDDTTRSDLKKLPVLPTAVLKEHPSLAYCEDRVIEHYKQLKGISRGEAIVRYLKLVESLPTYGVHYFEVKDKQGIPWWLGISYRGIGQFDLQDKLKPRKLFRWRQLENLYFREKKFAVEVNDPHRRVVPKRALGQSGLVIHTWYASHSLIKSIWGMAISQHQFYLDRKQSKAKITTTKSLGDIAMDLTEVAVPRISKLPSLAAKDQLIMASNGSLVSADSLESEGSEEQKKEKIAELKKKEKGLQDLLTQKLEELKKICLREAELTGKLPKDYPLAAGEKAPNVRRRMGTAFKLDDLFPYNEDPFLRNLESRFALQQKIVEAAQKLAGEMELGKTVKKKRRRNLMDAMKRLQEIEDEINAYRMKTGLRPTQRASLIIPDDVNPADLSSLSDSLTQEDDEAVVPQRQRSRSVQYSAFPGTSDDLEVPYPDRRASTMEQYLDSNRLNHAEIQDHYVRREAVSSHGTPHRAPSRQPRDARSMPPTPTLTRNAYSSIQLRSDDGPQLFRQRSGSLESQTPLAPEMDVPEPVFTITPARRSNSTELLDDGSSYTSQSSMEYCAPAGNHGNHASRYRYRRNRKGNMYANTGSMPNLAQNDPQHPRQRPTTTAYYVTGYPRYAEPEPHAAYVYESDMEGLYSVNPSYSAYQGQEAGGGYGGGGGDEVDGIAHNPYATLRPPRNRPPSRNEQPLRNFQKALVAEHLRGWYNRNAPQKQTGYDYERGSQHSLGYQTMPAHYGHNNRTYSTASSSSNAGNWRGHLATGLSEYDLPHYQDYQDYQYHHHHHQQQHPPHQHHHQHQYQQHYQYQHQHQLSPCHYSYGSMPTHSRPPLSDRRSSAQHSARTPSHLPALPSARTSSSSSYHSSYRSSSSSSLPLPSWWPVGNAGSSPQWPRGSRCEAASGNRAVTGPLLGVARDSRTWT